MFGTALCLLPTALSCSRHSQGKPQLTAQRKLTVWATDKAFVRDCFGLLRASTCLQRAWQSWGLVNVVWFLAAMSYKRELRKGCGRPVLCPCPQAWCRWVVPAGPALFTDTPSQGMEPYNRPQTHKLESCSFLMHALKSLPAYVRNPTDLTALWMAQTKVGRQFP